MDEALSFLNGKILDSEYTEEIGSHFRETLLLIISNTFGTENVDNDLHVKKCIALSKLLKFSPEVQRFVQLSHITHNWAHHNTLFIFQIQFDVLFQSSVSIRFNRNHFTEKETSKILSNNNQFGYR